MDLVCYRPQSDPPLRATMTDALTPLSLDLAVLPILPPAQANMVMAISQSVLPLSDFHVNVVEE